MGVAASTATLADNAKLGWNVYGGNASGNPLAIYNVTGAPNELYALNRSTGQITVGTTNLCVNAGGLGNGTPVTATVCATGNNAQQWSYPTTGPGPVKHNISGRCIDLPGNNRTSGTTLQLYDCNGSAAQNWNIVANALAAAAPAPAPAPAQNLNIAFGTATATAAAAPAVSAVSANAQSPSTLANLAVKFSSLPPSSQFSSIFFNASYSGPNLIGIITVPFPHGNLFPFIYSNRSDQPFFQIINANDSLVTALDPNNQTVTFTRQSNGDWFLSGGGGGTLHPTVPQYTHAQLVTQEEAAAAQAAAAQAATQLAAAKAAQQLAVAQAEQAAAQTAAIQAEAAAAAARSQAAAAAAAQAAAAKLAAAESEAKLAAITMEQQVSAHNALVAQETATAAAAATAHKALVAQEEADAAVVAHQAAMAATAKAQIVAEEAAANAKSASAATTKLEIYIGAGVSILLILLIAIYMFMKR